VVNMYVSKLVELLKEPDHLVGIFRRGLSMMMMMIQVYMYIYSYTYI